MAPNSKPVCRTHTAGSSTINLSPFSSVSMSVRVDIALSLQNPRMERKRESTKCVLIVNVVSLLSKGVKKQRKTRRKKNKKNRKTTEKLKRRNIEFCVRKRESARERESRNTQINATQRTAAKSDPPEPFSGEVSTLLLSTRQCVDTAHCVVRPNYNQDQGAQGESRFRLGPWTKGQSACTYGTTGMTCPVVLNFNAIRTHCDCDCDAITRVFC